MGHDRTEVFTEVEDLSLNQFVINLANSLNLDHSIYISVFLKRNTILKGLS